MRVRETGWQGAKEGKGGERGGREGRRRVSFMNVFYCFRHNGRDWRTEVAG